MQTRALSRQRSHKSLIVGYSIFSEALTETGPSRNEGNSGVSVKPPLPASPAAQPRAFKGIFGYFCFQDKSDSPISLQRKRGETAFDFKNHGGQPKQPISPISLRSKRGETMFSGFCASKTVLLNKPWRQPETNTDQRQKKDENIPADLSRKSGPWLERTSAK